MELGQRRGVAMAIYQDFAREFEGFQPFISNYANQDQPSDYLGLVAAMEELSPYAVLDWLGEKVTYTNEETPPATFFPNETRNHEFTPRVQTETGEWKNIPWPEVLQVDPINDSTLWRRQTLHMQYLWGLISVDMNYASPWQNRVNP